jgi:mannan endo-1,4-beta-mannosidase
MIRTIIFALSLLLSMITVTAQGTRYEAENGTLTGTYAESVTGGFSGTGYVNGFDNDGDMVTVAFTLARAGNYNIFIGYAGPYGDKKNILSINGNNTEMSFPYSLTFREAAFGKAWLREGSNTLSVIKSWVGFCLIISD